MSFRKDFIWGAATASYQIEGAVREDGRGESIWDRFCKEPGRIFEGQSGDITCDHYHLCKEDIRLMRQMGIRNYRFSISWTRLLPEGTGRVNESGIQFYNGLIDELLENGIRPIVTLFHWDYPVELQKRGAWENPDSVQWFLDYATLCAERFGDRVKDFITFNEPQSFIGMGYCNGAHAPGYVMPPAATIPMSHHVMLAHGRTVKMLRKIVPGVRVGYAPCSNPRIPVENTAADIEAARKAYFSVPGDSWGWAFSTAWWSDPVVLGRYPEDGLTHLAQYLPDGWEKDLKEICQPMDFYAQNIYNGFLIHSADNVNGYEIVTDPVGHGKTAFGWSIVPDCLYWGPKFLYERYHLPFMISENGMSCHDVVSLDGKVHDPQRQDYMHRYLRAFKRAAEDGVDAYGYLAWTLMDNFEWTKGFDERFGLIYVDFQTQQRIIKDSFYWFKDVMETNGENL